MAISISGPTFVITETIHAEYGVETDMLMMDGFTTNIFEEAATFTSEDTAREFLYHLAGLKLHNYFPTYKIVEVVDGENRVEY